MAQEQKPKDSMYSDSPNLPFISLLKDIEGLIPFAPHPIPVFLDDYSKQERIQAILATNFINREMGSTFYTIASNPLEGFKLYPTHAERALDTFEQAGLVSLL